MSEQTAAMDSVMQQANQPAPDLQSGPAGVSQYTTPDQLTETVRAYNEARKERAPEPTPEPEATPEAPAQEESVESKTDRFLQETEGDPRFAALAKRERDLREREASLNSQLRQKKEAEPEAAAPEGERDRLQKMAKINPLALLAEFGVTYGDVSSAFLGAHAADGSTPEPKAGAVSTEYEDRMAKLEKSLTDQQRERDNATYQQSMTKFLDEIEHFVDNGAGKYELVKASEEYAMVADVMQRYYDQTEKVMAYDDACRQVEDHLLTQVRRYAGTKKIATMFTPAESSPPQQEAPVPEGKTLTQKDSTTPAPAGQVLDTDKMSKSESLEYLTKNFNFWKPQGE